MRDEQGDTPPPYFQALMMAFFATFALFLDALFLAPTMDLLFISDPALQYLAAAGFAALFTGWFELCGLHLLHARTLAHKRIAMAAGGLGVLTLSCGALARAPSPVRRRPRRKPTREFLS